MNEANYLSELHAAAHQLAKTLVAEDLHVVFAESCTSGMIAAALGTVPGISNYLCGSAVTYRIPTKKSWLNVSAETLDKFTAESQETTDEMALGVLSKTAEAEWALAITGHFGPDVENEFDGRCFLSISRRGHDIVAQKAIQLESTQRTTRQLEAAKKAIDFLKEVTQQPE